MPNITTPCPASPNVVSPRAPGPKGPPGAAEANGPEEGAREHISPTATFTLVDLVTPVRSVHASFSEAAREAATFRFPDDLLILVHDGPDRDLIQVLTATGDVVRTRHARSKNRRSSP